MAPTYGLAEQAADIIKAKWNGALPPSTSSSTATRASTTVSGSKAASASATTSAKPSGAMRVDSGWFGVVVGLVGAWFAI